MHSAPSRREKRDLKFLRLAEQGLMSSDDFSLYKSEERALRDKDGFDVCRHGLDIKKELPAVVSWGEAFKDGIPLVISNYISGDVDTFPKWALKNWAQELYVIAARVNFEKTRN